MLEQKQKLKGFQEVLDGFPENAKKGLLDLQNFAFEQYKKEGNVAPFNGFFTIKEDKLVVFKANDMKMLPPNLSDSPVAMDYFLKGFKTFLEGLGHDIKGFILIQQAWMKNVHKDEVIEDIKDIKEAPDRRDCLMFFIDSTDYSFTLIYEKINSGEDYVISPEPIEELYVDKKDPNTPISLEKGIYNFF